MHSPMHSYLVYMEHNNNMLYIFLAAMHGALQSEDSIGHFEEWWFWRYQCGSGFGGLAWVGLCLAWPSLVGLLGD